MTWAMMEQLGLSPEPKPFDWAKFAVEANKHTKDLYQQKCSALFEHMYEKYPERGAGVYAGAA
jgi:predicted GTPase